MESSSFFTTLERHNTLLQQKYESSTSPEEREQILELLEDANQILNLIIKFQEIEKRNYRKKMNIVRGQIYFQMSLLDWRISQKIH